MQDIKLRKKGQYIKAETAQGTLTFSLGNAKLSKDILIFNLTAGTEGSCVVDCPGCYAKKAEKRYPTVKAARAENFRIVKEHPEIISQAVPAIVAKYKKRISTIRIHESGDMFSKEYALAWDITAGQLRIEYGVKTYTYTKTGIRLHNVNVVESILPTGEFNFGRKAWVEEKAQELNAPICPATKEKEKDITCGKDCGLCIDHKTVLFIKH